MILLQNFEGAKVEFYFNYPFDILIKAVEIFNDRVSYRLRITITSFGNLCFRMIYAY